MEYAIVFPLQLMITLGIIQLAQLFVAKQVCEYAAFCGARAALAGLSESDARTAALIPLSRIAGPGGVGSAGTITIPGWGSQTDSEAANVKTVVTVTNDSEGGHAVIRCDVEHDYELMVPVADEVMYGLGDVAMNVPGFNRDYGAAPHLKIKTSCVLAHPWNDRD